MKRIGFVALALVASAFIWQNPDLKTRIDGKTAMFKPGHAAAADSGIRIDRAGYGCSMFMISSGQADNAADSTVVVLIDSIPGTAAWQKVDSITVDTVDNKIYKMGYKGVNRWIRLLARASGNAADTYAVAAVAVQGCKRAG